MQRDTILVGVDGGGTGCRARACRPDGTPIGQAEGGSANIFSNLDGALATVIAVVTRALEAGGLSAADLGRCHVGLGLAGANIPQTAAEFLSRDLPFGVTRLETDVVTACLGAHGGRSGGLAVLGTGTAYVARSQGRHTIFGCWGFMVSDRGSGADLGRRVLTASLLAHEDLGPRSALTDAALAEFEGDPALLARFASRASPGEFGRFAKPLWASFDEADKVATAIVEAAVATIEPPLLRLLDLGVPSIALVGGLAPRYRPLLSPDLRSRLVEPEGDALQGALMLARSAVQ